MKFIHFVGVVFCFHWELLPICSGQVCNGTETFIKLSGITQEEESLTLMYSSTDSAVTGECYNRCKTSTNCEGFIVDYDKSACFRVNVSNDFTKANDPSINASNYFIKACLQVPQNCTGKWWVMESVTGYELVLPTRAVLKNVGSAERCMDLCLTEERFLCRSAGFRSGPGFSQCALSTEDRRSQPESYRPTLDTYVYLENQCIAPSQLSPDEMCLYEDFPNTTLGYTDLTLTIATQQKCQASCKEETKFNCRGITFLSSEMACLLHGDDSVSLGPHSRRPLQGAVYLERAPCINLMVNCSSSALSVTLKTTEPFNGRLYVQDRSEMCNAEGLGSLMTMLTVPIRKKGRGQSNICGLRLAKTIGQSNRTLISSVIVIQRNSIIQQRGDRAVKVGCLIDSDFPRNISLQTTLSFSDTDSLPGVGTILVNSTTILPTAQLQILDRSSGVEREARETKLGQDLQFRIDVDPPNGFYDIKAGHLVATSETNQESYLLLDERGCPPNPQTFPAFVKAGPDSKSLIANFRAFKFPSSPIVKFNVIVQFCNVTCKPYNCGDGIISYGRRKRDTVAETKERQPTLYEELLPLQLALIVHSPQVILGALVTPSPHNSNILLLVPEEACAICLDYGAVVGMVAALLLLQFLLLLGCYCFLKYKHFNSKSKTGLNVEQQVDYHGYDNRQQVHWMDYDN